MLIRFGCFLWMSGELPRGSKGEVELETRCDPFFFLACNDSVICPRRMPGGQIQEFTVVPRL